MVWHVIGHPQMLRELEQALSGNEAGNNDAIRFELTKELAAVRLCGLHRKPRVREYSAFLEWAAVRAPNQVSFLYFYSDAFNT